jgi:hypothetical protein
VHWPGGNTDEACSRCWVAAADPSDVCDGPGVTPQSLLSSDPDRLYEAGAESTARQGLPIEIL